MGDYESAGYKKAEEESLKLIEQLKQILNKEKEESKQINNMLIDMYKKIEILKARIKQ